MWWIREWMQKNGKGGRPFVLYFARSRNIEVSGILIKNSPYYNFVLYDCENGYIHDMEIFVGVIGKLELSKVQLSYLERIMLLPFNGISIPTFPLNTDGIDIWGRNFTI